MNLDPTITFGAILNAAVLLVGFIVAFTRIGGRIDLLTQRIGAVETSIAHNQNVSERLAIIETRQATHGQMISGAQDDIRELKHGEGFTLPLGRYRPPEPSK